MKIKFLPTGQEIEGNPNKTLLQLCTENNIEIRSICKGVPSCAECRVRISSGESNLIPPNPAELSLIGTNYFMDGRRLSCQVRCFGPVTVDLAEQIDRQDNPNKKVRGFRNQATRSQETRAVQGTLVLEETPQAGKSNAPSGPRTGSKRDDGFSSGRSGSPRRDEGAPGRNVNPRRGEGADAEAPNPRQDGESPMPYAESKFDDNSEDYDDASNSGDSSIGVVEANPGETSSQQSPESRQVVVPVNNRVGPIRDERSHNSPGGGPRPDDRSSGRGEPRKDAAPREGGHGGNRGGRGRRGGGPKR